MHLYLLAKPFELISYMISYWLVVTGRRADGADGADEGTSEKVQIIREWAYKS